MGKSYGGRVAGTPLSVLALTSWTVRLYICFMSNREQTPEEIEFRPAELELFMKQYGLEGFDDILDCLLQTLKEKISRGEISATEAGVMKAMSFIVAKYPEIDRILKRFNKAVTFKTLNEMKQTARPN